MATNPYAPGRNPWTMPTTGPGATGAGANAYNQYQQMTSQAMTPTQPPNYGNQLVADFANDPAKSVNSYLSSVWSTSPGAKIPLQNALYLGSGGDGNWLGSKYHGQFLSQGQTVESDGQGGFRIAQPQQQAQQAPQGGQMQPWQLNPYLQQQADGIASSAITDFQRTIAPGIRSGAMAAGGYGGSRQGIAEGIAVGDLQRNIANAQSKLFGDAYEGDQNRATTRYASDNSLYGSMYGADRGLEGTKYSADAGERSSRYSADSSRAASRYSADAGLAGTRYSADSSRAASAYGADRSFDATRYSSDNTLRGTRENIAGNRYIAEMGDRTTQRGQDMNFSLGDRRLGLDARTADQNYGLGLGAQGINQQNANTNRLNADNQYTLGLGNLGVNQGQLGVAQQNAATNRLSTDNAYNLGLGQLGVSQGNLEVNRTNATNSANAANNNYLLGLGNLGVAQANAGTNAAGTGAQMTTGSLNAASNLLNSLYQMGVTDMNNPLMQMLLPYINSLVGTSTGNTTTTTRP